MMNETAYDEWASKPNSSNGAEPAISRQYIRTWEPEVIGYEQLQ